MTQLLVQDSNGATLGALQAVPLPALVAVLLVPVAVLWLRASRRAFAQRLVAMPSHELLARCDIDSLDKDELNAYAREYLRRLEQSPPRMDS